MRIVEDDNAAHIPILVLISLHLHISIIFLFLDNVVERGIYLASCIISCYPFTRGKQFAQHIIQYSRLILNM